MDLFLNFHTERVQSLSDLMPHGGRITLSSEKSIRLQVRVISNHGQTFFATLTVEKTPVDVPYDPPWGRDWAYLQLTALDPKSSSEAPHVVKMHIEKIDCWAVPRQ